MSAPRSTRVEVNGWVVLDKPAFTTSTSAVSRLKFLFNAKKAGHAGTLDPLATGILPIAFGEATKTVPFVQDGEKAYRFTIAWGAETSSDDAEGEVTATSDMRPSAAQVEALLPRFIGEITQIPPAFSAIKIGGERAYDLARSGAVLDMPPRQVTIHALRLVHADAGSATLEAECGKGTYVRAIARDLGRALGCYGHVIALRRTRVGPFLERDAVTFEALERDGMALLRPVDAGIAEVPSVIVDRQGAAQLRRGQALVLRGRDAPGEGVIWASCGGVAIAIGTVEQGALHPERVFTTPY
ncbi:MAG: tRNA pseudouridine(55) synthase TruB [Hyphomicrobiales bacterium]|nr:tRNA pseudouridine(55) synthase TruB [Hyphomicrobiales bacterium]